MSVEGCNRDYLSDYIQSYETENYLIKKRCEHYRVKSNAQEKKISDQRKELANQEATNAKLVEENRTLQANIAKLKALNNGLLLKQKNTNKELEEKEYILHHEHMLRMSIKQAAQQMEQKIGIYSNVFKELRKEEPVKIILTQILNNLEFKDHDRTK
jgi:hypothetical protein